MAIIHPIQISILKRLMYAPGSRYSQMKPEPMEGSQFTFHLDQLLSQGLIEKSNGLYSLTDKGKGMAGKLDLSDIGIEEQAKISVLLVCSRFVETEEEILLYTRKKTPFFGYQGFPTGKVKRGEDIMIAAGRELLEETGLHGEAQLFAIRHYKVYQKKDTQLLEDKVYFAIKFTNVSATLVSGPEGEYQWVNRTKIWEYLKKPVPELNELIEHLDDTEVTFKEGEYFTEEF